MNADPLDDLLRDYAGQPVPAPSRHPKPAVWARVEAQKRRRDWLGIRAIFSWRDIFAEPRVAVAGLALALITGVVPVAAAAGSFDRTELVRDSLHLQCFTNCPSCLAGTMRPEDT